MTSQVHSRLRVPAGLRGLALFFGAVWLLFVVGCGRLGSQSSTVSGGTPPTSSVARTVADGGESAEPRVAVPSPDAPLAELVAWIRPRPAEEPWAQIPWGGSLRQAQSLALQTHRLIFLWGTNQPTGRC